MKSLTRREFLETVPWGAAAIAARPGVAFQKSGERSPNIVFILTDDLGYGIPDATIRHRRSCLLPKFCPH